MDSCLRRNDSKRNRRETSLVPPETVKKLQATLHAKAKDAPHDLGRVWPAYRPVNYHAERRLRQWLCGTPQVRERRGQSRFSDKSLHEQGLGYLEGLIRNRPWANA